MFQSHSEMPTAPEEVDNTLEGDTGASSEIRGHYVDVEKGFNGGDVAPSIVDANNIDSLVGFMLPENIVAELKAGEITLETK